MTIDQVSMITLLKWLRQINYFGIRSLLNILKYLHSCYRIEDHDIVSTCQCQYHVIRQEKIGFNHSKI